MAAAPTPATPAAEALLAALADRPGATATELAQAAEVGRSTAAKLLTALAAQGRVLRQRSGRRAPDRWTLPTAAPIQDPSPPPTTPPALPAEPIPAAWASSVAVAPGRSASAPSRASAAGVAGVGAAVMVASSSVGDRSLQDLPRHRRRPQGLVAQVNGPLAVG